MGFFDFLKRKEEKIEKEKIRSDQLGEWLQNKQKSNEEKERKLLSLIKQKVLDLTKEFEPEIAALKNFDWSKNRAEEKVMFIIKENLNNYIILLSKLNDNLKDLDETSYGAFIEKINFIFVDFEKKSSINFQKANFLIGKEFGDVKKSISNFFRGLKEILENNQEFIEALKTVSFLLPEHSQTENIEKIKFNLNDRIKKIEQKKADLKDKTEFLEKEIKRIIESKEYSEKIRQREEAKMKQNALKQDIIKLKEFINLKYLARIFHKNEKKMKIIRAYNDDFFGTFENNRCTDIFNLVDDAKKEHFNEKLTDIQRKKQEIESFSEKDEIATLQTEKEKISTEIDSLGKEKSDNLKKVQKLEERRQEIWRIIKQRLANIKVELE